MISVGETLRRERIRRNLDLDQISQELKISARFLDAIEKEQFERLPARIFAKNFVRQYAHLLELDEEELADEVQRQLQPPAAGPQTAEHSAAPPSEIPLPRVDRWEGGVATNAAQSFSWSSSLPSLALFVVILLVCSGIYSLWQRSRHTVTAQNSQTAPSEEVTTAPPVTPAAPPAAPAGSTAVPEQSPASSVPPAAPAPLPSSVGADRVSTERAPGLMSRAPEPANRETAASKPAAVSGTSAATSATEPGAAPAGGSQPAIVRATTSPNPSVRVEVTATEAVWVLAQNNGKYLFSGTLEPNQTKTIEADGAVTLRLGNAGGVNILLNGKPIGAVGPRGQVRTVQFTSGGFHMVPAPKPSVPLDDIP
jgi:cytoskeleton protein RodZ